MLRLKILLQSKYLFLTILVFSLIIALFRIYFIKYESKYHSDVTIIQGKIINISKTEEKYSLTIKAKEKIKVSYYYKEDITLKLGMNILVEGKLIQPINNTLPNTFNYRKYLNNHKIYYIMSAKKIRIINDNQNIIFKLKNNLYDYFEKYEYQDYLKTFVIGDKSELDQEMYENYQNNGVAHLFAISGMHINILAGLLMTLFRKVKYQDLIIIIVLLFYVSLTNYSASIIRTIIFYILIKINRHFEFNISSKNILFLTAALLIFYNPLIIYDLGFQYSAIVTYGLIISSSKIKTDYFTSVLRISFYAFLFSLPITLMTYYEINIFSILNNLIFAPLISIIIYPVTLLSLFLRLIAPLVSFLISIMEEINTFLNNLKYMIIIPKVNPLFYLIYYLFIIFYIYSFNRKYLIIAFLLIFSFKLKYYFDLNTYVYFIDVGQGDSTLIYNRKEVILIDTGGVKDFKVSNNTIRMIKSFGINKIDLIILTHGDADHALDTSNFINKMKVRNIMINSNNINELEESIIKIAPNIVKNYQSHFKMRIINEDYGSDENLSSIIVSMQINHQNLLFMGDAPKERERPLLKDNIKADIIKLGHHGSKTSSDYYFLKEIGAKQAIISSGRNNLYHHPSNETINTLEKLQIKYYNTQENGTICYIFGRKDYLIKTYLP